MSNRIPIRARVLKKGRYWLVIFPSGRRRTVRTWGVAVCIANEAVSLERKAEALKNSVRWPNRNVAYRRGVLDRG